MKLDEYGRKNFAVGNIVKVNGKEYRFETIVPNSGEGCDLYSEGIERMKGFCGGCNGCGMAFPEGTTRGKSRLP